MTKLENGVNLSITMKEEFHIHNLFRESAERFLKEDPHLRRAAAQPFSYVAPLVDTPEFRKPGILMLTGGRQVGKTTSLKQLIHGLVTINGVPPENVSFMTGELIRDDDELRRELLSELKPDHGWQLIIVDEVSYIKDWDKAVKFLADTGAFEESTLILTGSDSSILREAMKRFAGRRGRSEQVDFVFHPLSFAETVALKAPELRDVIRACRETEKSEDPPEYIANRTKLMTLFNEYLLHGGYLTAIADIIRSGAIEPATFRTYSDWLRGDILKHGKQEKYLLEILRAMMRSYASQISWVSLTKQLSIEHHKTVSDYVAILEDMNAAIVQEAFSEHRLCAAPKKAKKLYFEDPFIFHAVEKMIGEGVADPAPLLAESVAAGHFRRQYGTTYYIKGDKGEVDIVYLRGKSWFPVEVKWTNQLRPEDLKQIMMYKNGLILGKNLLSSTIRHLPCMPLIRSLLAM